MKRDLQAGAWLLSTIVFLSLAGRAQTALPPCVSSNPSPCIFVSNFSGHQVMRLDQVTTDERTTWVSTVIFNRPGGEGDPAALPEGIVMAPDGRNIYVADSLNNRIFRAPVDGSRLTGELVYVRVTTGDPDGPEGLSFNTNGDLFFNTRTGIGVWKIAGGQPGTSPVNVLPAFSTFGEGTAFDGSDNLLAVDSTGSRLLRAAPPYTSAVPLITSGLNIPVGVALNSAGDIFVANAFSNPPNVLQFAPDGTFRRTYDSFNGCNSPRFMMFDARDNLYLATSNEACPLPRPAAPNLSRSEGGSLPAGTYYVKISYWSSAGESSPSPESSIVMFFPGTLIVNAPIIQPPEATGYKVYISSISNAETLQATVTGWANYSQSTALTNGSLPNTNTGKLWKILPFSDPVIYSDPNGNPLVGVAVGPSGGAEQVQPLNPNGGTNDYFYNGNKWRTTYPANSQYTNLDLALTPFDMTQDEWATIAAASTDPAIRNSRCARHGGTGGRCLRWSARCLLHATSTEVPCPTSSTLYLVRDSYNSQMIQTNPEFLRIINRTTFERRLSRFSQDRLDPTDDASTPGWSDWVAVDLATTPLNSLVNPLVAVSLPQNAFATAALLTTANSLVLPPRVFFQVGSFSLFVPRESFRPTCPWCPPGVGGFIAEVPITGGRVVVAIQPLPFSVHRYVIGIVGFGTNLGLTGTETSLPFLLTVSDNSGGPIQVPVRFVSEILDH